VPQKRKNRVFQVPARPSADTLTNDTTPAAGSGRGFRHANPGRGVYDRAPDLGQGVSRARGRVFQTDPLSQTIPDFSDPLAVNGRVFRPT
jgi:hypothetical protein